MSHSFNMQSAADVATGARSRFEEAICDEVPSQFAVARCKTGESRVKELAFPHRLVYKSMRSQASPRSL
jgi:hypothetical protein